MITYVFRFIKRFIVLVPGLAVTYVVVKDVYPVINKRIPTALAILAAYILIAYVLTPALLRFIRLFIRPKHIPLYSTTPDGFASDPINIGIVGTRRQLKEAMTKAGWYQADSRTPQNLFKELLAFLLKRPYPTAPFSKLYLFGRKQDIGFQLPIDKNPRHRHHVRFWSTTFTDDPKQSANILFWQRHQLVGASEKTLWVGCASKDTGFALIRHNAQPTHMISPDTDAERELIAKQLQETGLVKRRRSVKVGAPYQLRNRAINGYLRADGKMTICEL